MDHCGHSHVFAERVTHFQKCEHCKLGSKLWLGHYTSIECRWVRIHAFRSKQTSSGLSQWLNRFIIKILILHLQKRMWRKNRQATTNAHCPGVDVNRNFDPHFGGAGTSKNPCSENYHGLSPLSERESLAVARFIDDLENTKLYISFHAFGQLLMFPYVSINSISRSIFLFLYFNQFCFWIQGYKRKHAPNYVHLVSHNFANVLLPQINKFLAIETNWPKKCWCYQSPLWNTLSRRTNLLYHL